MTTNENPQVIYDFLKFDTASYPIPKLFVPFDIYEEAVRLYDAHLDELEDDEWIMLKKSINPYSLWSETIRCSRWDNSKSQENTSTAPDGLFKSNCVEKGEVVGDHKGGESI